MLIITYPSFLASLWQQVTSACTEFQQASNYGLLNRYVRIGNGNQLVRDRKKLIRMLASEKIRWSLHTARLRLAKKQQYCQFFTRFGKCNKNSGKCPYIHDPGKVAICTKFLRGLCKDASCKLTHKVRNTFIGMHCLLWVSDNCSNSTPWCLNLAATDYSRKNARLFILFTRWDRFFIVLLSSVGQY